MKKRSIIALIVGIILITGGCSFEETVPEPKHHEYPPMQNDVEQGEDTDKDPLNTEEQRTTHPNIQHQAQDDMRDTTFYYQDKEGLLIPITRKTDRIEGIGRASVHALVDMSVIREDVGRVGLYPVLPANVQINGMSINNGLAVVDFNKYIALGYTDKRQEQNILHAIVYTLTEFHTIDMVQIVIDGQKYENMRFGYPSDVPLKREGINTLLENSDLPSDDEVEHVKVYYTKVVDKGYFYYVPVSTIIPNASEDVERYTETIKALLKAPPSEQGLKTYIPVNTVLKEIKVEGQTAILDFDDKILAATQADSNLEKMLDQIALCFRQFDRIKNVKVTANGKALEIPSKYAGQQVLEVPKYVNQF